MSLFHCALCDDVVLGVVTSSRLNHGIQLVSGTGFGLDLGMYTLCGFHPGFIDELRFRDLCRITLNYPKPGASLSLC